MIDYDKRMAQKKQEAINMYGDSLKDMVKNQHDLMIPYPYYKRFQSPYRNLNLDRAVVVEYKPDDIPCWIIAEYCGSNIYPGYGFDRMSDPRKVLNVYLIKPWVINRPITGLKSFFSSQSNAAVRPEPHCVLAMVYTPPKTYNSLLYSESEIEKLKSYDTPFAVDKYKGGRWENYIQQLLDEINAELANWYNEHLVMQEVSKSRSYMDNFGEVTTPNECA